MTGEEFWRRLSTPAASYDDLVRVGIKQDDNAAPFPTRFDYSSGMPPLCRVLGKLIGKSPDRLYDGLAPVVSGWPRQSVADHTRALFAELATRLSRSVIVERSGASLGYLGQLYGMFPEACFVFLYRDGPDAALSMSQYPTFRLAAIRELAKIVSNATPDQMETLPPEIREVSPSEFEGLTQPPFDKDRFLEFPVPLAYFGWVWSDMTRTGTREIRNIPCDQWMTLRYEVLLEEPREQLTQLAAFIGADHDEQWLDRACALVDPGRAGSAVARLHPGELAALRSACGPGARAFDVLESEHKAANNSN
jgi:hypothetical protein